MAAHVFFPKCEEPSHKSPLPVWIKMPIIAGVILTLILLKRFLQGFMTMFPMVGVVASYESRFSLGTVCRAIPDFMLAMVPMLAVVRVVQPQLGLVAALGVGWLVFIPLLAPLIHDFWAPKPAARASDPPTLLETRAVFMRRAEDRAFLSMRSPFDLPSPADIIRMMGSWVNLA